MYVRRRGELLLGKYLDRYSSEMAYHRYFIEYRVKRAIILAILVIIFNSRLCISYLYCSANLNYTVVDNRVLKAISLFIYLVLNYYALWLRQFLNESVSIFFLRHCIVLLLLWFARLLLWFWFYKQLKTALMALILPTQAKTIPEHTKRIWNELISMR